MNPGTFYLYEYENDKRTRNVGFIKVNRHYRSCILQIHARGIPVGNGASVELFAFFRDTDQESDLIIAEPIAVLNCFGRNLSFRLSVSESSFPEGRPLPQIDGFLMKLPGSNTSMFWMASSSFFDVDIHNMKIASEQPAEDTPAHAAESMSELPAEPPHTPVSEALPDNAAGGTDIDESDSADMDVADSTNVDESDSADVDEDITAETPGTVIAAEAEASGVPAAPCNAPVNPCGDTTGDANASRDVPRTKKIQRKDIAQLPRKFWPIANNSFLLHGYHNYGHLMLIEEDGRKWLGVPGTYAPQEARAADLFGFPRFTRSCVETAELTAEEQDDSADFGYWCRCLGNQSIPFIS